MSPSRRKRSHGSRPDCNVPASIAVSSPGRRTAIRPAALPGFKTARSRGRRHFLRPRCADCRSARPSARAARCRAAPPAGHSGRVRRRQILVLARGPRSANPARRSELLAASGASTGTSRDQRRKRLGPFARNRNAGSESRQPRADIKTAIGGGAPTLLPLLAKLADKARPPRLSGEPEGKPPSVVLPIDQGEELFLAEGATEAEPLLALMRDLLDGGRARCHRDLHHALGFL